MDKIENVQSVISNIIDEISMNIQNVTLDEIDGQNSDMIIQRHIVSAGLLLEKLDRLKYQIDNGELDGQSNLGAILNSEYTQKAENSIKIQQEQAGKKKDGNKSLFGANGPFKKAKEVRRSTSFIDSAS